MKTILMVFSLLLISCATKMPSESPNEALLSQTQFTDEFLKRLHSEFPDVVYQKVDDLQLKRVVDDESKFEENIFLGNLYEQYQYQGGNLSSILDQRIQVMSNREELLNASELSQLLPVIKPKEYIQGIREQLINASMPYDPLPVYYEEFNEDMVKLYVFDTADALRYATHEDMGKITKNIDLADIANTNLMGASKNLRGEISVRKK